MLPRSPSQVRTNQITLPSTILGESLGYALSAHHRTPQAALIVVTVPFSLATCANLTNFAQCCESTEKKDGQWRERLRTVRKPQGNTS